VYKVQFLLHLKITAINIFYQRSTSKFLDTHALRTRS